MSPGSASTGRHASLSVALLAVVLTDVRAGIEAARVAIETTHQSLLGFVDGIVSAAAV
jgi:hypothetical protein